MQQRLEWDVAARWDNDAETVVQNLKADHSIGGRKGGAAALLILRVLHMILILNIEVFSCKSISPTWFDCLPPPLDRSHRISEKSTRSSSYRFNSDTKSQLNKVQGEATKIHFSMQKEKRSLEVLKTLAFKQ